MSYLFRTLDNPRHRGELFARLARLDPGRAPRWGTLTAPRMLVHLCDQMRMPFNDRPSGHIPGVPRFPVLWYLFLYVLPWPRGTVRGPAEAFRTEPGNWPDDVAMLKRLVDEFQGAPRGREWAVHPNWGRLSRRQWGVFCYRHFDHHLRQFGV